MKILRFGEPKGNSSIRAIVGRINSSATLIADLSLILSERSLPVLDPAESAIVEQWTIETYMAPMLTGYIHYPKRFDPKAAEWLSFTTPIELMSIQGGAVRSMDRWYRLGTPSAFAEDSVKVWSSSDGR
ncbi:MULTISPECIES: hypothetical protein [Rhizobium]|uniref:hypothetical protein n=1 Tax=Rhizobium TaxID=379 RepID=UPI00103DB732|nr:MULTISPECIES: hypothetical protein [Rhizobium]MBY5896708.1 hypothetical protein [Rhizobium leguminosarum]NEH78123.1 hypothetical protein [Rhizobium ruizarguesonis]TBY54405.1 hypothetical protein E0H59_12940 [Rhizobium leguminosarum bv. viciae]UFW80161.1 hypothetical protein RlegSU303_09650 [Rhizobium leguminosarum bv. viciae]